MSIGSSQVELLDDVAEDVRRTGLVLVDEPARLKALEELFPASAHDPQAEHPIDLDALNRSTRPRGFLATWDAGSLLFFRLYI